MHTTVYEKINTTYHKHVHAVTHVDRWERKEERD